MQTQLNRGLQRRLMYVENKAGLIDGVQARVGWVSFSRTGRTIYYRGLTLQQGGGLRGNFFDPHSGEEYWVSGVKKRGSNAHPAEHGVRIEIDEDAVEAYESLRSAPLDRSA